MALTDLIPWARRTALAGPFVAQDRDPFFSLQRDMNRLLDEFTRGYGMPNPANSAWTGSWPHLDVSESDKAYHVTAELPGLEEKDVELSLHDGVLTLKGEKSAQNGNALYTERWHGKFARSVQVGPQVDPDQVSASFKNGVLTVTLAKRPEAQAQVKRIPIAAN